MIDRVIITRPSVPINVAIDLPRSKSISNRALICASLAGDLSCVRDLSTADDTRVLHQLLAERPRVMHCGFGGTTFRFLLAWACVQEGEEHIISGEPRLLQRPHHVLILALRSLGADIERTPEGFRVRGRKLKGGEVVLDSPISSQFISALMMIAPLIEEGLRIVWKGRRLSEPYAQMTAKVMGHFGVKVEEEGDALVIPQATYRAAAIRVPPDWSAAAFWYEIVAMAKDGKVLLAGLVADGFQGDEKAREHWRYIVRTTATTEGVRLEQCRDATHRPMGYRLDDAPDLFQPLAATLAGTGQVRVMGMLHSLVSKESDRLATMQEALTMLGLEVHVTDGQFGASGEIVQQPPVLSSHGDHRMAMALAPLALVCDRITILDPDVVNKSYPNYWKDLEKAGFGVEWE